MPAYNAARHLERAINSVARQTFHSLEVIVVDDASTDQTAPKARKSLTSHGLRHKVEQLVANSGPSIARNSGVKLARGEYIAFLDADDEWLPDKLKLQVALMNANPSVTLCGCQADWNDESGQLIRPLYGDLPAIMPDGWKLLLWNCYIQTSCAMVRRLHLGAEPFNPNLYFGEDRDLWIRLGSQGAVGLVHQKLVTIWRSRNSLTAAPAARMIEQTHPMIRSHLAAFAPRLNLRDRLRINGSLCSQTGKSLSGDSGRYLQSAKYLLLAMILGYQPADCLRHIILTNPVVRTSRTLLKNRRRATHLP